MFRSLKIYIVSLSLFNMKILKEKSREYKGKPYYKYKINLPEELLKEADFKEGDDLVAQAKDGEVRLRKR